MAPVQASPAVRACSAATANTGVAIGRQRVGQHDLLPQAGREEGQPHREIGMAEAHRFRLPELRHHLLVVDDRPGDELREEGHEQAVVQEPVFRRLALGGIDQIRHLLEGEERDAERQDDGADAEVQTGQRADILHDEDGIFEVSQQRQIAGDAEDQQAPLRRCGDARRRQPDPSR